ncbi:hypothetical protein Anas_03373 [Armadillidium nasatum]|uniref:Uncharacterized protein n=1 Tax=Armadillidium nasatum TaxID=96803 RepID=A0A5N5TNF6_9CRUS|nr:hypothetical protein Anas_03373 [Armadillidium nasatum]
MHNTKNWNVILERIDNKSEEFKTNEIGQLQSEGVKILTDKEKSHNVNMESILGKTKILPKTILEYATARNNEGKNILDILESEQTFRRKKICFAR